MTFEEWYKKLKRLAAEENISWFICEDKEAYREHYDEGETPEEALSEEKSAAMS